MSETSKVFGVHVQHVRASGLLAVCRRVTFMEGGPLPMILKSHHTGHSAFQ